MNTETVVLKTKGEIFKEKHGYSRTMAKNMAKHETFGVEAYRSLRKRKRKEAKLAAVAKRDKIRAAKKAKVSNTIKKK